jgi:hypothetical protein
MVLATPLIIVLAMRQASGKLVVASIGGSMSAGLQTVRVASYLTAAQADLAWMLLAADNIPAWLDNAALVSWFWYWSNATGGVKVRVPADAVDRARATLRRPSQPDEVATQPWTCATCQTSIDAPWTTCWLCGTSETGEEDARFFEEPSTEALPLSKATVARTMAILAILLFLVTRGSVGGLAALIATVAGLLLLRACWRGDSAGQPDATARLPGEQPTASADVETTDEYTKVEDVIRREWQAAVFGLAFFPLMFYSVWLLLRLKLPDEALRWREQRRYVGAWCINLYQVLIWGMILFPSVWL